MHKVFLLTLSMAFLGACTSTPDIEVISKPIYQPFPANLLVLCEEYRKYESSAMEDIIITNSNNMAKAINCKNKQHKLVEVIKEREKAQQ